MGMVPVHMDGVDNLILAAIVDSSLPGDMVQHGIDIAPELLDLITGKGQDPVAETQPLVRTVGPGQQIHFIGCLSDIHAESADVLPSGLGCVLAVTDDHLQSLIIVVLGQPCVCDVGAGSIDHLKHRHIAVPIFLASFYGLRRSELLGLRWSSINFETGWLQIDTTVVREKNGDRILAVVRENTTKTSCSRRSLPLCQYTYQYFWNLRQKQLAQMSLCGTSYDPRYTDLVCVDDLGTLLQPDYVSQKFQKVLEKYQLRRIRFHDLRHSCATIMLYLGYSLKDIQTWLGHSNYNFTADTYIHSAPAAHQRMASTLAENLSVLQELTPIPGSMC